MSYVTFFYISACLAHRCRVAFSTYKFVHIAGITTAAFFYAPVLLCHVLLNAVFCVLEKTCTSPDLWAVQCDTGPHLWAVQCDTGPHLWAVQCDTGPHLLPLIYI
jgi:hypothetical protein